MSEEKLVPKLRFPSYSSEWHSYTLGEILTFYSTNSFSREKLNYDGGSVKNIHYGDIHTKFPSIVSISNNKDIPFINNEIDLSKYSEDQYLQNGDLIIADASEDYEDIGKAIEVKNINDEKVLAGLHTILARDNNNITVNGFKAYLFSTNSLKTKIKIIANGISVLGISKNNLSKLTVNVPSKNEQNDVVDFISLIDNKIELLEQKHQYYQEFKKFLMQQIFAQKLRFDYEEYTLKEICEKIENGFSGTQVPYKTQFPVTRIETISSGKINYEKVGFVDEISERYKLKNGDILLTNINSLKWIGNAVYYDGEQELYHGMNLMLLRTKKDFNSKYLYYYISYNNNWFKKMACQAVNQASINKTTLEKFKIKFPSITDQNNISNVLTLTDEKIQSIQNKIELTNKFKKGLLQQMFV